MASGSVGESTSPGLPAHVSIFNPANTTAVANLLAAKVFTRLSVSSSVDPSKLSTAVSASSTSPPTTSKDVVSSSFCLQHGNVLLVFDVEIDNDADLHHEHVRTACMLLKDEDFSVDYARCVFDATTAQQAGFQFDGLKGGAVMVIDLMAMGNDEESSSDEGEDEKDGVEEENEQKAETKEVK